MPQSTQSCGTNMDGCIVIKDDVSAIRFFEAGGVAFVTTKYKYRGNMSTTPTTFSYKLRDRLYRNIARDCEHNLFYFVLEILR